MCEEFKRSRNPTKIILESRKVWNLMKWLQANSKIIHMRCKTIHQNLAIIVDNSKRHLTIFTREQGRHGLVPQTLLLGGRGLPACTKSCTAWTKPSWLYNYALQRLSMMKATYGENYHQHKNSRMQMRAMVGRLMHMNTVHTMTSFWWSCR